MQDQKPGNRSGWRRLLGNLFPEDRGPGIRGLNIRGKIILPYLVLTLGVALVGIYVVTSLVAGSLDERLTNQLLEAGRVVSDSLARREIQHLESARLVVFTQGLNEALQARDRDRVAALARPVAAGAGIECLIVVDAQGREMLHVLKQDDGSLQDVPSSPESSSLWIVQALLDVGDPDGLPQRGIGLHPQTQRYYYFTAIPVGLGDEVVGVVVVGAALDDLLVHFKATSLADIIMYLDEGRAVATTFASQEQASEVHTLLDEFSISPEQYTAALYNASFTSGENLLLHGRWYRLARGPLRVANNTLGVYAIALPSNFIIEAGATSRNNYSLLFTAAMACVILVGYLISQRINQPLSRLVSTSQAVAKGNLKQRTGISRTDEIGLLAASFDEMTSNLEERTIALEKLLQAQRETSSRLEAILASIGDGVLFGTPDGSFTPLNDTALTLLRDMADDFQVDSLREMASKEQDLPGGEQPNLWLLESRRLQMGKQIISTHASAVRTDDGERLGSVVVLRDITAEVESEQIKDAFVARVSHELRTPLTSIKGYCALLLADPDKTLGEQQRSFLQTISGNTQSLVEMVNGLLDFSEMEAKGRLGLQRQPVSLSDLVDEIAAEWRPRMADQDLAFDVETVPGLPLVEADIERLRWAMANLVRNAWQYTPAGGKVSLRLSASNDQVIFDVADTGVGISPEDQAQLFSRFYRAGTVKEDERRGLGLSLYVSKVIVEAYGGEIRVVSQEGVGSTFSVVMPALPVE